MAQMASPREYRGEYRGESREEGTSLIANPTPLGLVILALATALIGASFARFLIPATFLGISTVVAPILIYGGIVLILAGMWSFRRNNTLDATLFSAYGGFLIALGVLFIPRIGTLTLFGTNVLALHHALGLLFLCWTICCGIFLVASLRTNMVLMATLACLFLAYLFLTIGEFANANFPLLAIGGWLAIVCALLAWYEALATILRSTRSSYQLPTGDESRQPFASGDYGREPAV